MYIPLRIATHASIGLSTLKAADVAAWAKDNGIPAVGVTEMETLAGSMATSKALVGKGVQPVLGAQITLETNGTKGALNVYARSQAGHKALLAALNTAATQKEAFTLDQFLAITKDSTDDLVILTGGRTGLLAQTGRDLMEALVAYNHVFVEIERVDGPDLSEQEQRDLAAEFSRPLVATSPMLCRDEDMAFAHEAYLSISAKTYMADADRPRLEHGAWLVDAETFAQRFADIPEAVEATVHVAKLCAMFVEPVAPKTPAYAFTDGQNVDSYVVEKAEAGLETRLVTLKMANPDLDVAAYQDRLAHELTLIGKMGFSGYFLIVADFINWARKNDIPVGPGRGSGAGSLVAYALGITDIDPLAFGLLFERLLNPDRVSMPDFDIDFSQARRGEVIAYVRQRYGDANVAHIGTYSVLQPRAVVRNVGRVMGLPYPLVDRFAKMIPQNPTDPISLEEAMEEPALAAELETADDSVRTVFQIARKLEGLNAHMSTHAAGVVISDTPVADIVPVHLDEHGMVTTSFDMKDVENAGLVKFDFLGLKNLDIIDEAIRYAADLGHDVALDTITFQDDKAYSLLAEGDGFGVFQVESAGMRRAMRMLNVDTIDDLIALISLYRPGPMDQIETYANVKAGTEDVSYLHPDMESVLGETHGVMVYQEQVMKIAQKLAGYSLGQADLLRRAMGKKIQSEMEQQRDAFVKGAQAGWVTITLENGTTKRLHANAEVVVNDGSGRRVPLETAMAEELDVLM